MSERIDPSAARLCEECNNLVTTEQECPLCDGPTKPHPDANDPEHYCMGCAGGPFKRETLHLVTWHEDPYLQTDDGDLTTYCEKCRAEKDAELSE